MLALDDLTSPVHRKLFQNWLDWCGEKPLPHKSHINPIEIGAAFLPYIIMLEALEGGKDYKYRLVGTALTSAIDRDFTGETVANFFAKYDKFEILEGYQKVRNTRKPLLDVGDFREKDREFITYQRLILPFEYQGDVNIMLACFHFDRERDKLY